MTTKINKHEIESIINRKDEKGDGNLINATTSYIQASKASGGNGNEWNIRENQEKLIYERAN